MADGPYPETGLVRLFWTRGTSLTTRILAVNIIALGLLAASLFYIDSYRNQLLAERFQLARAEAQITADALAGMTSIERERLLQRVGTSQGLRLRLYAPNGKLRQDSFALADPAYVLIDPATEPWLQHAARAIDTGMDAILGTTPLPAYRDPAPDRAEGWPEIAEALADKATVMRRRAAPDMTPMINAATPVGTDGTVLLATRNARDITQSVRDARQTLAIAVAVTLIISIQLSLFLARTIVQPLRALVRAAVRVRLGRDRTVVVPRLPERRDEIGLLARALSDMTAALRQQIDAVESFAADVAHEIKNPLASLRSALDTLGKVDDPQLRGELTAIASHDVRRIDRLVSEIAEASRIDAELSRTQFVAVDLAGLVRALTATRREREASPQTDITISTSGSGPWIVRGDPARLERVVENLLDNALSFSPENGVIRVRLDRDDACVTLTVEDDGPGIPVEAREKVFERFHSLRPDSEAFGSHSGLGLAIARTIAEAHDGTLRALDRSDGKPGACLELTLPVNSEEASE